MMEVAAHRGCSVRYVQTQTLRFVWTIEDFQEKMSNERQGSTEKGISLTSPVQRVAFQTQSVVFRLKARFPCLRNGGYLEHDSLSLYLDLDRDDYSPEESPEHFDLHFHLSVTIISLSGHHHTKEQDLPPVEYFVRDTTTMPSSDFIAMNELMSRRVDLIPNDTMTIICQGTLFLDLRRLKILELNFMSNFEGLWQSCTGSDAVLVAQGKEFQVHRVVLQARSPVFEDMLNQNSTEKRTGRVVIEDIDPPIVEAMIRFIYTDEEPSNLPEIAIDLIVAARKYSLERLQNMCERHLASILSLDNIMLFLDLSIRHSFLRLKRACSTFAVLNYSALRKVPYWESTTAQEYPDALLECIMLMMGESNIDTHADRNRTIDEEDSLVRYEQREKFALVWKIKHFKEKLSNHRQGRNTKENTLTSPVHQVTFGTHAIRCHLKAKIYSYSKNYVNMDYKRFSLSLYYYLDDEAHDVTSHCCSVTIKSASGRDYTKHLTADEGFHTANNFGRAWESDRFISMIELKSTRGDLLPNDTMTIVCEGEFGMDVRVLKIHEPDFRSHFEGIFQSGSGSDAVLVAEGKEFLVHRVVLQARSPVFEAMFNHDTTEKRTGRVVIEDMDPPVVEAIIRFIYTDEEPPNLPEIAPDLMVAAGRYGLERLQNMCENQLAKSINLDNIMFLLNISACYSCPGLKRACCTFAKLNSKEMRKASYWGKNLVREYPDAVMELLECMKITPDLHYPTPSLHLHHPNLV